MIAILMSIKPKWCELIASGKKTIEVRKTRPKIETPFKVYIYATKENPPYCQQSKTNPACYKNASGKVIGEFVCDYIDKYSYFRSWYQLGWYELEYSTNEDTAFVIDQVPLDMMCLTKEELLEYGKGSPLYGLHISELKIYDKPKSLSDFGLKRAPQSWCYVKERETE